MEDTKRPRCLWMGIRASRKPRRRKHTRISPAETPTAADPIPPSTKKWGFSGSLGLRRGLGRVDSTQNGHHGRAGDACERDTHDSVRVYLNKFISTNTFARRPHALGRTRPPPSQRKDRHNRFNSSSQFTLHLQNLPRTPRGGHDSGLPRG